MQLEIISGGIGSGKSSYLYNTINKNLCENPLSNAILIVPEQFSYTAEKTLSEHMGGLGPNRIEVLTLSRLCNRFLHPENTILPSGKMMLIQKAISGLDEANIFYVSSKRAGFTEAMSELFSEFKRYGVSAEDFESLKIQSSLTSQKLEAINAIYRAYTEYLSEGFFDSDDSVRLFAEYVASCNDFKNTYIYIDDYNDFMPQHYAVIEAFLSSSMGVYVTLGMDKTQNLDLFEPILRTKNRLIAIAKNIGATFHVTELSKTADYIKADDIRFLLENWDLKPEYDKKCENIKFFNALDMYSEVEHTAAEIISLVRDSGYRFRDIGVICGDMEQYLYLISSIFADFDIPFFTDEKLSVAMHPISKTVLSLFDIIAEDWSYKSVFAYLRLGYIYEKNDEGIKAISQEDIDILENYVLLHGIKGKKMWFSEWTQDGETVFDDIISPYKTQEFDLEFLNKLRENIIAPFVHFLENRGRTASAVAEAVFNFMCDINLCDGLILECENLEKAGFLNESEQFKQTWNLIMETLDQLVSVLGKGSVSREDFMKYFACGLSGSQISIIPSGLDRVSLGTVSRNSPSRVKVLFILGATEGKIPKTVSEGTILSDIDRSQINEALSEAKKELAPDNLKRISLENLKLYRTLSTATEKLYISCPSTDAEGNALSFSHFVSELLNMFHTKADDDIISKPPTEEIFSSAKRGFYYLLKKPYTYYENSSNKLVNDVFNWYKNSQKYRDKLDILKTAYTYKKVQPALSKIKAEMLYGKNKKHSITALEKFQKCPFSYYLEKGLYLTARQENHIEKSHIGSLVHAAICELCKIVENGATSISEIHKRWSNLSQADCAELVRQVMDNIKDKVLSRAKYDKNQLEYMLSRCEATLKASIETVRKSLCDGKYTAICYEKNFEVDIDWKNDSVTLTGAIDRIDVMEDYAKNNLNIRIIDYKSGNKSFSTSAVYDKVDMQLVLYALVASNMASSGDIVGNDALNPQISAILYSKVHDPEYKEISEQEVNSYESAPIIPEKLDGIIILDEDEENGTLNMQNAFDMDSKISENGRSDFLKFAIKKDGTPDNIRSKIASRHDFEIMSRYIRKAIIDAEKSIKSGKIDIKPYSSGTNSACDYCNFKEVCMFDSTLYGYRTSCDSKNYYELMEQEVSDNE